jgi:hypothetical protein
LRPILLKNSNFRRKDRISANQENEHLAAQPLGKERFRDRRQGNESSQSFEDAVGDKRVDVGIEVDQVAEGLDEEDETRTGARVGRAVRLGERPRDDPAELSEQRPPIGEERPDEPGHGKDVLPVRHGPQHAALDPVAVARTRFWWQLGQK